MLIEHLGFKARCSYRLCAPFRATELLARKGHLGTISIKDGKLEMKVRIAGSSEKAGRTKDMKQLSGEDDPVVCPDAAVAPSCDSKNTHSHERYDAT